MYFEDGCYREFGEIQKAVDVLIILAWQDGNPMAVEALGKAPRYRQLAAAALCDAEYVESWAHRQIDEVQAVPWMPRRLSPNKSAWAGRGVNLARWQRNHLRHHSGKAAKDLIIGKVSQCLEAAGDGCEESGHNVTFHARSQTSLAGNSLIAGGVPHFGLNNDHKLIQYYQRDGTLCVM